jgi:hypothetical protein
VIKEVADRGEPSALTLVNGMLRLKKHSFERVRKEKDFVNLIRVGRLLNCLGFSMQLVAGRPAMSSILEQRFHYRTIYLMGGYLYEGYLLVDDLWSTYRDEPFFKGLRDLKTELPDRRRKIVKKIRDGVGFHLDWREQATSVTLDKLQIDYVELLSFESDERGDLYVSAADVIDLNYLLDELKGSQTEPDTHKEIYDALTSLLDEFAGACDLFICGLIPRLDLTSYDEP